jgi:mycofactocin system transcriptional regulator
MILVDTAHAVDRDLFDKQLFNHNIHVRRRGRGRRVNNLGDLGRVGHVGSLSHGSMRDKIWHGVPNRRHNNVILCQNQGSPPWRAAICEGQLVIAEQLRERTRRGRPRGTSARELELIALRLFTERGFDATTVEEIAAKAGVSRRTFFRYYDSKAAVLWHEFDGEVQALRTAFAAASPDIPTLDAIRQVVLSVNHYSAADAGELRTRMNLIGSVPASQASAGPHYEEWERAVSEFAASRLGQPADSLYPLAIGRVTLAACRAAFDRWVVNADADLTVYLDAALTALGDGFGLARSKTPRLPS